MITPVSTLKDTYPLPVYRFQVEIYPYLGSLIAAISVTAFGGDTWSFSEVSGLESSFEHQVYRDGMSHAFGVDLMRGLRQPVTITLRRGIVKDRKDVAQWMQTAGFPFADMLRKRNLRIVQLDENGDPLVAWTVVGAMPIKLTGPHFKASDNDVAVESIELIAEHLRVEYNP
jgi:phage tail-like protein